MNPVFLIDEIDKMGADYRGDPASAMLEVLDPEQHSSFRDHYLDPPSDPERPVHPHGEPVETIPPPPLDRMDVINLSGYTEAEKFDRAALPRAEAARGARAQVSRRDQRRGDPRRDPRAHARGRRQPRATLARCSARPHADRRGPRQAAHDRGQARARGSGRAGSPARWKRTAEPGVATGLAVTPVGVAVPFIEATAYPGRGRRRSGSSAT